MLKTNTICLLKYIPVIKLQAKTLHEKGFRVYAVPYVAWSKVDYYEPFYLSPKDDFDTFCTRVHSLSTRTSKYCELTYYCLADDLLRAQQYVSIIA